MKKKNALVTFVVILGVGAQLLVASIVHGQLSHANQMPALESTQTVVPEVNVVLPIRYFFPRIFSNNVQPLPSVTPSATSSLNPGNLPTPTGLPTEVVRATATATSIVTLQPTVTRTPSPTASVPPAPETTFGIEAWDLTNNSDEIAGLGAKWTRQNSLQWPQVEPNSGDRNWAAVAMLEARLQAASRNGLETILIIRNSPAWAQKIAGSVCGPIKENALPAFGKFMFDVVKRYSAPPFNVKYFELGNEVDVLWHLDYDDFYGCWANPEDPVYRGGDYYAEMLKATYPQIKLANPNAQVMVAGMLADCDPRHETAGQDCSYTRFFEGILRAGGADYFDGLSFHTYDWYYGAPGKWGNANWSSNYSQIGQLLVAKASYYKYALNKYNVTGKFIMNTEAALLCATCIANANYETAKAWYVAETYAAGLSEGLKAVLWYSYEGWNGSGLVDNAGTALPVVQALRIARTKFGDATYLGSVTPSEIGNTSGVLGYKFKHGSRTIWLVRSWTDQPKAIQLSRKPVSISDVMGEVITPTQQLTLTLKPIYIEWVD